MADWYASEIFLRQILQISMHSDFSYTPRVSQIKYFPCHNKGRKPLFLDYIQ